MILYPTLQLLIKEVLININDENCNIVLVRRTLLIQIRITSLKTKRKQKLFEKDSNIIVSQEVNSFIFVSLSVFVSILVIMGYQYSYLYPTILSSSSGVIIIILLFPFLILITDGLFILCCSD